jgi:hypothetical protein
MDAVGTTKNNMLENNTAEAVGTNQLN